MQDEFEQVKAFHQVFDPPKNEMPTPLSMAEGLNRMNFKIEEMVEYLYASANGNEEDFNEAIQSLHENMEKSVEKVKKQAEWKPESQEQLLVDQVDALIDLMYFTYGTFVLMGVDPRPLHQIVHQANMAKIFPDGLGHYDDVTGKVLKPENWLAEFAPETKILDELIKQKNSGMTS